MLAQDRATFRPCDENVELWLVDQTDGLLKEHFPTKGGGEPAMIYVEVYGERGPVTDDTPAAARAYAGTLVLEDVLYAGVQADVRGCAAPAPTYIVAARGNVHERGGCELRHVAHHGNEPVVVVGAHREHLGTEARREVVHDLVGGRIEPECRQGDLAPGRMDLRQLADVDRSHPRDFHGRNDR